MPIDGELIKLLIPVLILQIALMVFALIDLRKREEVLGDNKLIWVVIIVLFQLFGPLVYFILGRKGD